MRVVASPEAVAFVQARGGHVFVWTVTLDAPTGGATVFALEASTDSPGAGRAFVRFAGPDFEVHLDPEDRGLPDELHFAVRGWPRKRLRAYWNGNSFGRA